MTLTSGFTSYGHVQIFSNVYREGDKACQIGVFNILHNICFTIFTPYDICALQYLPWGIRGLPPPHPRSAPSCTLSLADALERPPSHFESCNVLIVCLFVCLPPPVPSYLPATSHLECCYLKQLKIRTLDTISIFITQPPLRVYAVAWTVKNLCPTKQTSDR